MNSWHLHIEGQVQGVGFRPFVYKLAQQFQLNGWVNNTVDGVHIVFHAEETEASSFSEAILSQAPRLAHITAHHLQPTEASSFIDFQILHSCTDGAINLMLTPDFAMCTNCREELQTNRDRRQAYPFITCTHCGPRFSITRQLPYDRDTTTMKSFQMCPECRREYHDPMDRRYYAQTNSCPACAIPLSLVDRELQLLSTDPAYIMSRVAQLWEDGFIVAIKGIGGYLLCCDARNTEAIQILRDRKYRPDKPFAIMYPSLDRIEQEFELHQDAKQELLSYRSPIVLLPPKAGNTLTASKANIAPGLSKIGVMLPYSPLFELLLQAFGHPVVATSGNISNTPIVFEDEQATGSLSQIADFLLMNSREIVVPQDDSVVQYSPFHQEKIILRRSRGMAPNYFGAGYLSPTKNLLATGAMLKSTFALSHQGNIFISQYLGDLQDFATEERFQFTLNHFLQLFDTQPEKVLVDQHPEYASTRLGQTLAQQFQVPVESIQHHKAHFGAILGEHQLLDISEPILGVIWDGTGLGEDGQIWGGEFFLYQDQEFKRWGHFDYFPFFLGDKMPKEPRISAFALCWDLEGAQTFIRAKFSDIEWSLYQRMLSKGVPLQTSSVGRLFDAIASILGLGDRQTYEGEAAIKLEQLATGYYQKHGLHAVRESYWSTWPSTRLMSTRLLLKEIIKDLQAGRPRDWIAAKFHYSLANSIKLIVEQIQIRHVACSGGVFQNGLLVDLIKDQLPNTCHLYFHHELSPNDECVSFGQLICDQIQQRNIYRHVLSDSR